MNQEKIGSFLSALRRAKGLTQQDLADIFHVSNKTVSKWECGDAVPEITALIALAEFYEVSVDEILKGEKIDKSKTISLESEKKNQRMRQQYFLNKREGQLKIYSLISFALMLISISLLFILVFSGRIALGLGLGISLFIVSVFLFFIGISITKNQAQLELEGKVALIFNLKVFKMRYIFINIIITGLLLILQLNKTRSIINLFVFIPYLLAIPLYYYDLKSKIYGIKLSEKMINIKLLISKIRPIYLLFLILTFTIVFFRPLYTVAYYPENANQPLEEISGSFVNILTLRPSLIGLYIFLVLFITSIVFSVIAYLKKKPFIVSYLLMGVSILWIQLVLMRQYTLDVEHFRSIYTSFSSTISSFNPFIIVSFIYSFAGVADWAINYLIEKNLKLHVLKLKINTEEL